MSQNAENAHAAIKAMIGQEPLAGDWMEITQERVNDFADATLDHQFIHLDQERAAATPFGGTIAHGFLTLSLLVHLSESISRDMPTEGILMGVNYGLNKVRFLSPVRVGKRIRAHSKVIDVTLKGNSVDQIQEFTVEIEGEDKPALIAEWIMRTVYA